MNLVEWLDAMCLNSKNLTPGERERRKAERTRILKKADATMNTLRMSRHRGVIGIKLARRLEKASKGSSAEFKVADQMPELAQKQ
ncbi:hypothetical protein FUT88_13495 [Ralstonia sp. TCR112]|uniref:hypothetical protein n=1 Tax=Ralstonia sp. TCR112 TaxID=2601730 RepID=UPI0011BE10AA|nr:hypothetical protein [Ralstonia sp. TCR112]TXD58883.1 hypothetical protein FUT88_13495 [Ralstonia sp. TCR112]